MILTSVTCKYYRFVPHCYVWYSISVKINKKIAQHFCEMTQLCRLLYLNKFGIFKIGRFSVRHQYGYENAAINH